MEQGRTLAELLKTGAARALSQINSTSSHQYCIGSINYYAA